MSVWSKLKDLLRPKPEPVPEPLPAPEPPKAPPLSDRVRPLHLEGSQIVTDRGERWVMGFHTDFPLYKRYLDDVDIDPVCQQRFEAGSRGPRVTLAMKYLVDLDPRHYGDALYTRLPEFAAYIRERWGWGMEVTQICDAQMFGAMDWQRHQRMSAEVLHGVPGVLAELVNEFFKNGINPGEFQPVRSSDVLQSAGSTVDGIAFPCPSWDYNAFHPRRDWKWPFTIAATSNELMQYPGYAGALVHNEPIGADETPSTDRRSTDAASFEKMAVDCALWSSGGTFHSQAGLQSERWGPVQDACARAFFQGLSR
jgi:hypothetical protein